MTEEQRAKYQRSLDKMSAEQQAEFINAVEILNRSTSIKIVTIKRQKYYVVTYVDTEGNKEKNMKMDFDAKKWIFSPLEMSLKECLP